MIQIHIGEGKGKISAAVGLSARAAGYGFSVLFLQFLKDDNSGEVSVFRSIPGVEIVHCPINSYGLTFQMTEKQKRETAEEYDAMLDNAIGYDAFLNRMAYLSSRLCFRNTENQVPL